MTPIRLLRASAVCICFVMVGAHAQTMQSRMFERLHAALDLTPTQENGWMTFEQAYAIDPQIIAKRRDAAAAMPTLTAPQRVDLSISLMKADLESSERHSAALKTFYNMLSAQQRGIFDRETLPRQQRYD